MKGLILSGGKGTRLRPLTYTGAKQLVPVANKPVLFYAIENLVGAGITDIGVVVGDTREQVTAAVGDGSRFGACVTYIDQPQPLGIAHAVKIAEPFLGRDRFALFLGDNFIREGIGQMVRQFQSEQPNSLIILNRVQNPQEFGVAIVTNGHVERLIEKPKTFVSDLAVIGIYMFDHHVFEAVNAIKPSARGELEITETIQYLIDHGYRVDAQTLKGSWIDTGKMEDMLEANRLVLEVLEPSIEGMVDTKSHLSGRVVVEPGAEIRDSVLRGPVIIGQDTKITSSYVGPFTSIGHDCVIQNSEIEHSIIMEHSRVLDIEHRIENSLIGRYVEIARSPIKPRAFKLMLGDHSKVGIL